jgi:hypothetical protein
MQDLRVRAAFDFDCDKESLEITILNTGRQRVVKGCGRKAICSYVPISRAQWDWNMDSSAK